MTGFARWVRCGSTSLRGTCISKRSPGKSPIPRTISSLSPEPLAPRRGRPRRKWRWPTSAARSTATSPFACGSRRRLGDFRSPTMRSGLFTVTFWAGPASGSPIRSNQHWQRSSLHGAYSQTPRHCPRSEVSAIPRRGKRPPGPLFTDDAIVGTSTRQSIPAPTMIEEEHATADGCSTSSRAIAANRRRLVPGRVNVGPRAAVRVI